MAVSLTTVQRDAIRRYVPSFQKYVQSPQAAKDLEARRARLTLYQSLTREQILKLDEAGILGLITKLWATQFWKNQQYILDKITTENGLDQLRTELAELLRGKSPIAERYARFVKMIKHLGPASVTEMLSSTHPEQCAIWNDKARKALTLLGFADALPLTKFIINAKELTRFNAICHAIADELASCGLEKPDLFGVDYFLYEVVEAGPGAESPPRSILAPDKFDHKEICEHLRDIGLHLGFDADTEKTVGHGAKADVLWRAEIGNLGVVTYVFEVQSVGSIDSLILNLQKAKANPTVQKVVAVSDQKQLDKIQKEVVGLPAEFRDALAFMQVTDVETVHEYLVSVAERKNGIQRKGLFL